jgi:hypothetical protein
MRLDDTLGLLGQLVTAPDDQRITAKLKELYLKQDK